MAVALFLLSTLDETTATWLMNVYFFLLGFSLGLIIQVLVIAVQNSGRLRRPRRRHRRA